MIVYNMYIPIIVLMYFFEFPFGNIISRIVAIITAMISCSAHELILFIICTSSHY